MPITPFGGLSMLIHLVILGVGKTVNKVKEVFGKKTPNEAENTEVNEVLEPNE